MTLSHSPRSTDTPFVVALDDTPAALA
ncbi:MAG: hypothetical protein JWM31_3304, partial [Solirubrobacterales bacterium]|nr:hypothetical protein [Solirubrobacterales bacterium]